MNYNDFFVKLMGQYSQLPISLFSLFTGIKFVIFLFKNNIKCIFNGDKAYNLS